MFDSANYRNAQQAFVGELCQLLNENERYSSRNGETLEALGKLIVINNPLERCMLLPNRKDSIFAKCYEAVWVLAGRSDIKTLSHYLPRAADYSDDGKVWRGAYGPRLRHWVRYGSAAVDQVTEVIHILSDNPDSRRAVMTIFDPSQDFVESKDIPCNNWIQFLIRNGYLYMFVTLRSNDAMWGFSGINTFEWSILQELIASALGVEVGRYYHFVGSFHLYAQHVEKAKNITSTVLNGYCDPYEHGLPTLPLGRLQACTLDKWLFAEELTRTEYGCNVNEFDSSPLLKAMLQAVDIYNTKDDTSKLNKLLRMETSDIKIAVALHLETGLDLRRSLTDRELDWLDMINGNAVPEDKPDPKPTLVANIITLSEQGRIAQMADLMLRLERAKTVVYGDSWRKHGEVLSIFANISRKYDKLENGIEKGAELVGEGLVDTLIDMAVYVLKYTVFLAEQYGQDVLWFGLDKGQVVDYEAALQRLVMEFTGIQRRLFEVNTTFDPAATLQGCWAEIKSSYLMLEGILTSDKAYSSDKRKSWCAWNIAAQCMQAVKLLSYTNPDWYGAWQTYVESL